MFITSRKKLCVVIRICASLEFEVKFYKRLSFKKPKILQNLMMSAYKILIICDLLHNILKENALNSLHKIF